MKTLFYPAPGPAAVLVTARKGRMKSRALRFPDAHAALTWAIKHRAGFVYSIPPDPARN